jgi:hypothetical protein
VGRLRGPPLGARADGGRLAVEAVGDMSDSDDVRGINPGRGGKAPGPDDG